MLPKKFLSIALPRYVDLLKQTRLRRKVVAYEETRARVSSSMLSASLASPWESQEQRRKRLLAKIEEGLVSEIVLSLEEAKVVDVLKQVRDCVLYDSCGGNSSLPAPVAPPPRASRVPPVTGSTKISEEQLVHYLSEVFHRVRIIVVDLDVEHCYSSLLSSPKLHMLSTKVELLGGGNHHANRDRTTATEPLQQEKEEEEGKENQTTNNRSATLLEVLRRRVHQHRMEKEDGGPDRTILFLPPFRPTQSAHHQQQQQQEGDEGQWEWPSLEQLGAELSKARSTTAMGTPGKPKSSTGNKAPSKEEETNDDFFLLISTAFWQTVPAYLQTYFLTAAGKKEKKKKDATALSSVPTLNSSSSSGSLRCSKIQFRPLKSIPRALRTVLLGSVEAGEVDIAKAVTNLRRQGKRLGIRGYANAIPEDVMKELLSEDELSTLRHFSTTVVEAAKFVLNTYRTVPIGLLPSEINERDAVLLAASSSANTTATAKQEHKEHQKELFKLTLKYSQSKLVLDSWHYNRSTLIPSTLSVRMTDAFIDRLMVTIIQHPSPSFTEVLKEIGLLSRGVVTNPRWYVHSGKTVTPPNLAYPEATATALADHAIREVGGMQAMYSVLFPARASMPNRPLGHLEQQILSGVVPSVGSLLMKSGEQSPPLADGDAHQPQTNTLQPQPEEEEGEGIGGTAGRELLTVSSSTSQPAKEEPQSARAKPSPPRSTLGVATNGVDCRYGVDLETVMRYVPFSSPALATHEFVGEEVSLFYVSQALHVMSLCYFEADDKVVEKEWETAIPATLFVRATALRMTKIWVALEKKITALVNFLYPTEGDLAADDDLQSWAQELRDAYPGNNAPFTTSLVKSEKDGRWIFANKAQLVEFLIVINTTSIAHGAVSFSRWSALHPAGFTPKMPTSPLVVVLRSSTARKAKEQQPEESTYRRGSNSANSTHQSNDAAAKSNAARLSNAKNWPEGWLIDVRKETSSILALTFGQAVASEVDLTSSFTRRQILMGVHPEVEAAGTTPLFTTQFLQQEGRGTVAQEDRDRDTASTVNRQAKEGGSPNTTSRMVIKGRKQSLFVTDTIHPLLSELLEGAVFCPWAEHAARGSAFYRPHGATSTSASASVTSSTGGEGEESLSELVLEIPEDRIPQETVHSVSDKAQFLAVTDVHSPTARVAFCVSSRIVNQSIFECIINGVFYKGKHVPLLVQMKYRRRNQRHLVREDISGMHTRAQSTLGLKPGSYLILYCCTGDSATSFDLSPGPLGEERLATARRTPETPSTAASPDDSGGIDSDTAEPEGRSNATGEEEEETDWMAPPPYGAILCGKHTLEKLLAPFGYSTLLHKVLTR